MTHLFENVADPFLLDEVLNQPILDRAHYLRVEFPMGELTKTLWLGPGGGGSCDPFLPFFEWQELQAALAIGIEAFYYLYNIKDIFCGGKFVALKIRKGTA